MPAETPRPPIHPAARDLAADVAQGTLSRREFLTRATALGVAAPAAYGLIGVAAPAEAAAHARQGGTVRIEMEVLPTGDPRAFDMSSKANIWRGTFDYLVEYNNDGAFRPMLLARWEVNDNATAYTLHIRPSVRWSNGDLFTARDVARNIEGWCDADYPANSMASRMNTLVDPDTRRMRAGTIDIVDDLTLRLNLPHPDITIIPGMADYPAAIVHESFDPAGGPDQVGTGPYVIETLEPGAQCVLVRRPDHSWWGTEVYGGPYLDRIEFHDYGADAATWLAAMDADEVDMVFDSVSDFIDVMDARGYVRSEVTTANTIVIRGNQTAEVNGARIYRDVRVRRALALAVDNAICLELGNGNRGTVAENHHVSPIHPEYAEIPPPEFDPDAARALMAEAGLDGFEHELFSIDDDWRRNTADAVAALLRDAGIPVRRTIVPAAEFWENWADYPFSSTNWNGRPLGVQMYALAYRSGEIWNEFGFSNPEFDEILTRALAISDADRRRTLMERLETILRDEAVIIQPFWRTVYRHTKPGIVGAERHISDEIHLYKIGFAA